MPFYDYRCLDCKALKKDVYEQVNDDSKFHACNCGGEMKRIITSPVSIKFTSRPVGWNLSASERKASRNLKIPIPYEAMKHSKHYNFCTGK